MATWVLLFRYFRTVAPVPAPVSALTAMVFVICVALAVVVPETTATPLASLLVLQIFAASSGVVMPARRGYYDPLLSRGVGRAQLLSGQWLASTIGCVACWGGIAVLERGLSGPAAPDRALASGSLVALWLASSLPWAANVALPRSAAAIAWLVVLVAVLTTVPSGQAFLDGALARDAPSAWGAVATLVYPMGLVGRPLTPAQWLTVTPGLTLSFAAPVAAFLWFARADLPLEVSQ